MFELQALLSLPPNTEMHSLFEGGGAEVHRIHDIWVLFEIPLFGGEPQYAGTFRESELPKMLSIISTWT